MSRRRSKGGAVHLSFPSLGKRSVSSFLDEFEARAHNILDGSGGSETKTKKVIKGACADTGKQPKVK